MPTPPSSGVALRYAERWYESLHTTFTSRREVPHIPPAFRSGQGGLNSSLMTGLTLAPLRSGLVSSGGNRLLGQLAPSQRSYCHNRRTGISASYCGVRASSQVLTSKIQDRPQSITFDEPLGGRKRGPGRVMGLDWGFMESTHHTARTVGYSGESCTRRSNGSPRQV
jgi:hypothetical protein